jgi:hypothetical protein
MKYMVPQEAGKPQEVEQPKEADEPPAKTVEATKVYSKPTPDDGTKWIANLEEGIINE